MPKRKNELIKLEAKEVKQKIEHALTFDYDKYDDLEILFANKEEHFPKLPFSGLKVSIAEERKIYKAYRENIKKMLTYKYQKKQYEEDLKEYEEKRNELEKQKLLEDKIKENEKKNKFEQIVEGSKKRKPSKSKVVKVDSAAVVAKIQAEARKKHKGKKPTGRRELNKLLDPHDKKKKFYDDIGPIAQNEEVLTSIDIYLSAVNKINTISDKQGLTKKASDLTNTKELNLSEILKDLEK